MATIFRKLNQKRHWEQRDWLRPHEVQGNAIKCLITKDNRLSVYVLNNPKVQIERVVAALALTRDNLMNLDWATVPENVLCLCKIQKKKIVADTPDSEVNGWHIDLVELTVDKIAEFAKEIKTKGCIKRSNKSDVEKAICNSLKIDCIDTDKINQKLKNDLGNL